MAANPNLLPWSRRRATRAPHHEAERVELYPQMTEKPRVRTALETGSAAAGLHYACIFTKRRPAWPRLLDRAMSM